MCPLLLERPRLQIGQYDSYCIASESMLKVFVQITTVAVWLGAGTHRGAKQKKLCIFA